MASSSQNNFEDSLDDAFDEYFDQHFDQYFDQTFENFTIGHQDEARKQRKKRACIERNREAGNLRQWNDYFSENPTYTDTLFRRRFRMNKPLFMKIVDRLSNEMEFFRQKRDGLGRQGLSTLQKCTAAICVLPYGTAADAVDEYLRLGETTTRSCVEHFVEGIIHLFGDEYLRRPTPADLQRLLDIASIVCIGSGSIVPPLGKGNIHEVRKNPQSFWKRWLRMNYGYDMRFFGPPRTLNDINVLDRSPVFDDIINGQAPQVTFSVNGREYHLAYYLTDSIYPKWETFIQSISLPQGPKAALFAKHQEAVRKDVEHAFGVLQARFAIVKNPVLFWDKAKIGKIMRTCIILHNMIVEDERDGYTQFDVSGFQQGEETGSSHVNLDFSSNMPTNLVNMMGVRTRIRDRPMHEQIKADLVEHLWSKFGEDADNN
uniref:DDE Tnp4 domain-containing protein n=1 Tax=Brassica oleracea var. oleracea TaxID=109376 RepID=A0A0D3BW03_BRAOL